MKPQREQRWRLLRQTPLPHGYVRGGQGRSDAEVRESASTLVLMAFWLLLCLLLLWSMLP